MSVDVTLHMSTILYILYIYHTCKDGLMCACVYSNMYELCCVCVWYVLHVHAYSMCMCHIHISHVSLYCMQFVLRVLCACLVCFTMLHTGCDLFCHSTHICHMYSGAHVCCVIALYYMRVHVLPVVLVHMCHCVLHVSGR